MDKLITSDQRRIIKIRDFEIKLNDLIIYLKTKNVLLHNKLTSKNDIFLNFHEVTLLKDLMDVYLLNWVPEKYNISGSNFNLSVFDWIKNKINNSSTTDNYFKELLSYHNIYNYLIMSKSNGLHFYDITLDNDIDRQLLDDIKKNGDRFLLSESSAEQIEIMTHLAQQGFLEISADVATPTLKGKHLLLS